MSDYDRNTVMGLRENRLHQIEESSKMRNTDHPKKTRMVRHRYEPDRLSPTRLADAYEKVLPRSVQVLGEKQDEMETVRVHEQQVTGG